MRLPIQYAIFISGTEAFAQAPLSLTQYATLTFAEPDEQTFRLLGTCKKKLVQAGGLLPCVMNGANEIAVQAFLQERLDFGDCRLCRNCHADSGNTGTAYLCGCFKDRPKSTGTGAKI